MIAREHLVIGLAASAALLVVVVEKGIHGIALWNLLPLFTAIWFSYRARGATQRERHMACGFGLCASAAVIYCHVEWALNLWGVATGSSTSGLVFLIYPLAALFAGAIGLPQIALSGI